MPDVPCTKDQAPKAAAFDPDTQVSHCFIEQKWYRIFRRFAEWGCKDVQAALDRGLPRRMPFNNLTRWLIWTKDQLLRVAAGYVALKP
jgi:hypothetical protein